jgi:hypothetical protein
MVVQTPDNLPVLLAVVALALAALVAILLLSLRRRREPAHVQQASSGGVIYHRHDARVSVTVVVERSD